MRSRLGGGRKRPARYGSGSVSPALREALRRHKRGHYKDARDAYARAIADNANDVEAWANLASACGQCGDAPATVDAADRALALSPDNSRLLRDMAFALEIVGHTERAIELLEKSTAVDPALNGARVRLSRMYLDSGDIERALAHAEDACAQFPNDAASWLELHYALFDDCVPHRSIPPLETAIAVEPDLGWAQFLLWFTKQLAGHQSAEAIDGRYSASADGYRHFRTLSSIPAPRLFSSRQRVLAHAYSQAPLEGLIVELGVAQGVSTRWLATLTDQTIDAFDSFFGLPQSWQKREQGLFTTCGIVPQLPDHVRTHVGWFSETLPSFLVELSAHEGAHNLRPRPIRLLHVDCDIYESTKEALELLAPRLSAGSVIVFDEYYGNEGWEREEHLAMTETSQAHGWTIRPLAGNMHTGQLAVSIE